MTPPPAIGMAGGLGRLTLCQVAQVVETVVRQPVAHLADVGAEEVVQVPHSKAHDEDADAEQQRAADLGTAFARDLVREPDGADN